MSFKMPMSFQEKYISIDPSIHAGVPCVAGTRYSVASVLDALDRGRSEEEVLALFPGLTPGGLQACLSCRELAPAPGTLDSIEVESVVAALM